MARVDTEDLKGLNSIEKLLKFGKRDRIINSVKSVLLKVFEIQILEMVVKFLE